MATNSYTGSQIGAVIADDHPLMMLAMQHLVSSLDDVRVVGSTANAVELVDLTANSPCDLVVTDLNLLAGAPLHNEGLKAILSFRARFRDIALVVLTAETRADVLQNITKLGIDALVSKTDGVDVIRQAISAALAREPFLSASIRTAIARAKVARSDIDAVRQMLSQREKEVLKLYASGLGVSEIAEQLGRSIKTISAQKCTAMKKLALARDVDLYEWWANVGKNLDASSESPLPEATPISGTPDTFHPAPAVRHPHATGAVD